MRLLPAPDLSGSVRETFREQYAAEPAAVGRAPGRVNLIGEHTDYNAGLCLPIALPHATYAAIGPRTDRRVRVFSEQSGETWEGDPASARGWVAYAVGVIWALREAGVDVPGCDLAISSTVPLGSGLSSSAAIECAVAAAVAALVGSLDPDVVVAAAIRAETDLAGAPTGGMDQTVSVHASAGEALLIDFADGTRTPVPWAPPGLTLLVIDTAVRHALADGQYADRRSACEEACLALGVSSLRGLDPARLDGRSEPWADRARHVVDENTRVAAFADAVRAGDWAAAGLLMTASHRSLAELYEVSCPELDTVVDAALAAGALGARMTGGGFGGCAIALVPDDRVEAVLRSVSGTFADRGWAAPACLVAVPSGGAETTPGGK